MKKILVYVSIFILAIAKIAANTPSQLGSFQLDAPKKLKKAK
ncbi:MAG: AgrD family cyclic lactone autoinducer peptide [Massilimicrobiota timonensis]